MEKDRPLIPVPFNSMARVKSASRFIITFVTLTLIYTKSDIRVTTTFFTVTVSLVVLDLYSAEVRVA
jgi:hypothetical protein